MTEFNPGDCTYDQILGPAMKITDAEDAKQYLESYIEYLIPFVIDKNKDVDDDFIYMESVNIAKQNLGYFARYYDNETRKRVERLFQCSHPFFGSIENDGEMTAEMAFELGKKIATKKVREIKLKKINNAD